MNAASQRPVAKIRAEIEERFGFLPPFFEPAMDAPDLLEHLWRETLVAYLDNPLPFLFKEKLSAYLSRFCGEPYAIVCHSCALRPLGMEPGEILALLERPAPVEGLSPGFFASVEPVPGPIESWPEPGSELEDMLITLAVVAFVEPPEVQRAKRELRRLLGERDYSYLTVFLSYVWSFHLWLEGHPEVSFEDDQRVQRHLGPLLEAEPRLEGFFGGYRDRVTSEAADRATALVAHLEASEERYRALVDTAGDAIVSADADGRIISFNRAAEYMFGWRAADALGQPLTILMPERFHDDHEAGLRRYVETTEGKLVGSTIELAGSRREGGEFPLEISLAAWRSSGKQFFTGVLRDITERKRVEAELREATERFTGAFTNAAIGIALVSPDGRFLSVNDSLCSIVGYDRDDLIAKTFQDITHPEDLEADLELVGQVLAGEIETYDMEKRYFHADGHVVWILLSVSLVRDDQGEPVHFVAQIQDITARKQAEEELRSSEQRFRALASAAPVGIFEIDAAGDGVYVNERWCELAGRSAQDAYGKGWVDAVYPADRERVFASWSEVARRGDELALEYRFLRPNGVVVWVSGRAVAVRNSGEVTGYLCTVADITDLKRVEQRLSQLALTDDLTGLANRRRFLEELERHTERGARYGWRGAVLILDLDSLKAINDTLGHAAGDQLIKQAGARLHKRLRSSDFIARLGGDEFAVLLAEADADAARAVAQDLVETLAAHEVTVGSTRAATASVGVALIGEPVTAEEVLMRADFALYEAKAAGGNRFAFYDRGLDERFDDSLALDELA